jgi:dihydroorotate dehydrogenase
VKDAVGGKPLFLKIAPDLSLEAVDEIVDVAIAAGATGIIATNTTIERPVQHARAGEAGGLSGAPLSDRSTQVLARASQRASGRLSMIGSGGAITASDIYRKIRAGAQAVQLYTGFIYGGPGAVSALLSELAELVKRDGFTAVSQAVGADLKRT